MKNTALFLVNKIINIVNGELFYKIALKLN